MKIVFNLYVNLAEISVVVVDTDEKCNQLLDRSPKCLRRIISIRGVRPSTNQKARNRGVEILTFDEVEKSGASKTFSEQVYIIIIIIAIIIVYSGGSRLIIYFFEGRRVNVIKIELN